jgi:hypothetical protein
MEVISSTQRCTVFGQRITWGAIDRNLAPEAALLYYRHKQEKPEACTELFFQPQESQLRGAAMITNCAAGQSFEISPRFRRTVEERIARLERDAEHDELHAGALTDGDHIRRHMRLVVVQRSEALRMRLFLDRAKMRLPRPLIAL